MAFTSTNTFIFETEKNWIYNQKYLNKRSFGMYSQFEVNYELSRLLYITLKVTSKVIAKTVLIVSLDVVRVEYTPSPVILLLYFWKFTPITTQLFMLLSFEVLFVSKTPPEIAYQTTRQHYEWLKGFTSRKNKFNLWDLFYCLRERIY